MSIASKTWSLVLAVAIIAAGPLRAEPFIIFAAASMKTALDAVTADFAAAGGEDALISYAGSSVLARQIEQGAPADLFISANVLWMDRLEASGAIQPDSRSDLIGNKLVLIAKDITDPIPDPQGPRQWGDRLHGKSVSMALVDAVPAGIYGKAALEALGLWQDVAPLVVQTDNVRAALALVARGETTYGIVYASDAAAEPRVSVVATFAAELHPAIRYPVALTARSGNTSAQAFLDYLRRPDTLRVLHENGFTPLPE